MNMKRLILISFLLCLLFLTGCNYKEIERMPMLVGIGIDPKEDGFMLTGKIIIPSSNQGQGVSEQILVQSSGETLFDATRDFIMKEGEKTFWGQLEFIIINESIAQNDITEVLDFLIRDTEIRETAWPVIAEHGRTAEEAILATLTEKRLTLYVADALRNSEYNSKYSPETLTNFLDTIYQEGQADVLPIVSIEESLGEKRILVNGGLVIHKKKSECRLDGIEIQNFCLLRNKEKGGIRVFNYRDVEKDSKVSMEVIRSNSKMKLEKAKEGYKLKIDCTINGVIGEISNGDVKLMSEEKIKDFEIQAAEQVKEDIEKMFRKLQTYQCDIFHIAQRFKNTFPKEYKELSEEWESIFSSLDIEINVKVRVVGTSFYKQL